MSIFNSIIYNYTDFSFFFLPYEENKVEAMPLFFILSFAAVATACWLQNFFTLFHFMQCIYP